MLSLHGQLVLDIQASMLTRVAKVDSSSTRQLLAPSVNISAGYLALPDHDSMNNPSVSHYFHIATNLLYYLTFPSAIINTYMHILYISNTYY